MRFNIDGFRQEVIRLADGVWGPRPVGLVSELCPVDVVDVGYLLEDAGHIADAEEVFDLTVEELKNLTLDLKEAA